MHFNTRHILITGASGGIGTALAHALAEQGASLLLHGRKESALATLASECLQKGAALVLTCAADLSTADGRATLLSTVAEDFTQLDTLVNNAGTSCFQLFDQQSPDQIERLLTVNIHAPILLTQALLPRLLNNPTQPPAILNIGSAFGAIGFPGYSTYCASKAALRLFSEALSREYADTPLRVQYLAPRATRTSLNSDRASAMTRATGSQQDNPERVARDALRLLQNGRAQATVGWPEKLLVRLNGLRPELISRALRKKLPIIKPLADHANTGG